LQAARAACLRYLAQREHSRAELMQKLRGKGYDEAVVRAAVDAVNADGLQSDDRFLESFVRGRVARGHGPHRIRQELRAKGLDEGIAASLRDYDWDALIESVYARKYGASRPDSPKEQAARARFLNQRGFSSSQIGALFRRLRHDSES
jgi:regulatory protein